MKWIVPAYIILGVALVAGGVFGYLETRPVPFKELETLVTPVASHAPVPTATPVATPTPAPEPTTTSLPATVTLSVPFTSQAPYSKWDEIHEHTCEEASLLMAQWYAEGKSGQSNLTYKNQIPPASAESAMFAMNAWEEKIFGSAQDTNVEQTVRIAKEFLGLKATIKTTVTVQSIKQELAAGNIIIIPAAGRLLNNPNFKAPGPAYHMLVLTGYTSSHFIANDPGTRKGENYSYPVDTIVTATHDWLGEDSTILQGAKKVIVISK